LVLHHHFFLAALISFGLSLVFWRAFGGFYPVSLFLISGSCAAIGAMTGWLLGKKLWVTMLAAALLRVIIFVAILGPSWWTLVTKQEVWWLSHHQIRVTMPN